MAIAFVVGVPGAFINPGSSLTVALDCTGVDKLIISTVGDAGSDSVATLTYAGVSMTKVASAAFTGARYATQWRLDNPASGVNNIIAAPASGTSYLEITGAGYSGMAAGGPEAFASNTAESATSLTGTATVSTNGAWAVMSGSHQSGSITAGSGTTMRGTSGLIGATFDSNADLSPGSTSLVMTGGGTNPSAVIIAIYAPAGGGGGGGSTNGIAFGSRGGRALNAGKTFVGGIRRAALERAHQVGDRIASAVQRERITFGKQLLAGINT